MIITNEMQYISMIGYKEDNIIFLICKNCHVYFNDSLNSIYIILKNGNNILP